MNKENNLNTKSCQNCRYYSQHFSNQGSKIERVYCGPCLCKEIKNYKKRPPELCEFWEDVVIKKDERKSL